jgi:RimJ/RimL family protein N-acetyltransferase
MIKLAPFTESDFDTFIEWIDSEELLIQIAGTVFTYPLTHDQLQRYLDDEKSLKFNVVDIAANKIIGHAQICLLDNDLCKLDKVIIGKANRGKGVGPQLIKALVNYAYEKLDASLVELNVYDWNAAGIRCYEKAGFIMNPEKNFTTEAAGYNWLALNMIFEKDKWMKNRE